MIQVQVRASPQDVGRITAAFGTASRQQPLVLKRAVAKTARWVHTRVIRQASSATGLRQRTIKSRFVRLTLNRGGEPAALIKVMDKPIRLSELHPRQTETGVSYKVGGAGQERVHAFRAVMPTGHLGVFLRRGRKRLPIETQYEFAVGRLMAERMEEIEEAGRGRLSLEIGRQTDLLLKQLRLKKGG